MINIKVIMNISKYSTLFYTIQKLISVYTDVSFCVSTDSRNRRHLDLDVEIILLEERLMADVCTRQIVSVPTENYLILYIY